MRRRQPESPAPKESPATPPDPAADLPARYEIRAELGSGGSGTVYRARDAVRGADVALKIVDDSSSSPEFLLLAAHDHHPGLVRPFDFRRLPGGRSFFTMELARGVDLTTAVARGAPLEKLAAQVLATLDYLHSRGVLHLDLKPSHILVATDAGEVTTKLIDFGLARSSSAADEDISGTLEYIAPETLRGEPPTPATDLYGLGCVLCETLTGKPPHVDRPGGIAGARLSEPPPDGDRFADPWNRIVPPLLAVDPRDRPRTARAVLDGLRAAFPRLDAGEPELPALGARLVGRDSIVQRLESRIDAAGDGAPCVTLVHGATGIGKSRLLSELDARRKTAGARFWLHWTERDARPGGLLRDLVHRLRLERSSGLPPIELRTPRVLDELERGDAVAHPPEREAVVDAVLAAWIADLTRLLGDASTDGTPGGEKTPSIAIDALEHADSLSVDVLEMFLRWIGAETAPPLDLSLLMACRDESASEREICDRIGSSASSPVPLETLALGGIDSSAIEAYLEKAFAGTDGLAEIARELHAATGGNLFFVEEFIAERARAGSIRRTDVGWDIDFGPAASIPRSIEEAVTRRLRDRSTHEDEALRWIAVADSPLEANELLDLGASRDCVATLSGLARDGLLKLQGTRYRFAHSVTRAVAYARLSESIRREAHTTLARWIANLEHYESRERALAEHLYRSQSPEKARSHLVEAARRAQAAGALREAETAWLRALELSSGERERAEILAAFVEVEKHLGRREEEARAAAELTRLAGALADPELTRRAALAEAALLEAQGDRGAALARLDAADRALPPDAPSRAPVLARAALISFYRSEFDDGFRRLDAALALAAAAADRAQEAECRQLLGLGNYLRGDPPGALREMHRAAAIRRDLGQRHHVASLESNLGLIHLERGDLEAAEERFEASLRIFRAIGLRRGEAINALNLGLVYCDMGRYELALRSISRALDLRRQLGDERGAGADCGNLANVWMLIGNPERARPLLEDALEMAQRYGNAASESANLVRLARIDGLADGTPAASLALSRARELAERAGSPSPRITVLLAEAEFQLAAEELDSAAQTMAELGELLGAAPHRIRELELALLRAKLERARGDAAAAERVTCEATKTLERGGRCALAASIWWERRCALEALRDARRSGTPGDVEVREEEADDALRRAYVHLRRTADDFDDPELRTKFLEHHALHREIDGRHRDSAARTRREARRRERSFHRLAAGMHSFRELDPLLDHVLQVAIETTHAEKGLVLLKERDGQFLTRAARGMAAESVEDATDICRSVLRDVTEGGGPVLATDAAADERFRERQSIKSLQIHTLMCVPLARRDEVIGAIYVDGRGAVRFDRDDLDYLVSFAQLAAIAVENARLLEQLQEENRRLQREVEDRYEFQQLIGRSASMQRLFDVLEKVARTDAGVLIAGETGTGKEVVARAIHYASERSQRPFVAVDCGALPGSLLESELFGHERGAFSGAIHARAGLFQEADGGTIFLDEISNTSLDLQAKLLRVLQEGEIRRLGENRMRKIDVRVVAASNIDLAAAVAEGTFREDLYYRLNVVRVEIPPLRDRIEDIPLLARHFVHRASEKYGRVVNDITEDAMRELVARPWRGNVRELEHTIESAVILGEGSQIDRASLGEIPGGDATSARATTIGRLAKQVSGENRDSSSNAPGAADARAQLFATDPATMSLGEFDALCRAAERRFLEELVEGAGGNLSEAARRAGVRNRNSLVSRLKKHGLFRPR